MRNIEARALVALSMAGEQNPVSASRSSAFLAVETYRPRPGHSLEKKCDIHIRLQMELRIDHYSNIYLKKLRCGKPGQPVLHASRLPRCVPGVGTREGGGSLRALCVAEVSARKAASSPAGVEHRLGE